MFPLVVTMHLPALNLRPRYFPLVLFLVVATTASPSHAQVQLGRVQPFAFQRGSSTEVVFRGERLTEPISLVSYTEGLGHDVWSISEDHKRVTTNLLVPADFPRGWHAIRLATPAGVSDLRTIYVGDQQPVQESGQPHGPTAPQKIAFPSLVSARLLQRDVDAYAIDVPDGSRISAEIQGLRTGRAMVDLKLELLGPDGALLASCDDTPLTRQDPFISLPAPQAGRYTIVITETRRTGNGRFWYLLHVGAFPRPGMARPLGGKPGSEMDVSWINPDESTSRTTTSIPATATDSFKYFPEDEQGVAPTPVQLRVSPLDVVEEQEPNNNAAQATPAAVPFAAHGAISTAGDRDFFKFSGKKNQIVVARVYARQPTRSALDSVLVLRHATGKYLAYNDDANGPDSLIRFTLPADDDYTVAIHDQLSRGMIGFDYRLEVASPRPHFTLTVPEPQRNRSATVSVPQGNRTAVLLTATRRDLVGDITPIVGQLPAGVTVATHPIPAGRYQAPLLFEAPADAPLGCGLVQIDGQLSSGQSTFQGTFQQRQLLVAGRNNIEMWGISVDRLATAVTRPSPMTLQLIAPKVPLVRSGTMQLNVNVKRRSGFQAPIELNLLYNPKGVSSQRSVSIPADQTQGKMTLTANQNAALGAWPIVVMGKSTDDMGQFEVSTQIVDLRVEDRYFELAFGRANIEQGTSATFEVGISHLRAFSGKALAELVGLPAGVTAQPLEFTHKQAQLAFTIQAAENARAWSTRRRCLSSHGATTR